LLENKIQADSVSVLRLQGTTPQVFDGLIAAAAKTHNLIVVTRNVNDFAAFGVKIFNPWT
jgi:toxin FitB